MDIAVRDTEELIMRRSDAANAGATGPGVPRPANALPTWSEPPDPTLVTSDPRDVVRFLHDAIKLSDSEIALATGSTHELTVRRWRSPDVGSTPRCTARLDDLRAIVGLLLNSRLLYHEEVGRFLRSRNDDLGHSRPLKLLGTGEFDRVRGAAEELLERLAGHDGRKPEDTSTLAGTTATLPAGMTPLEQPLERSRECGVA